VVHWYWKTELFKKIETSDLDLYSIQEYSIPFGKRNIEGTMNRDARVQQWEKHLTKIIEQTNKNISSLPMEYQHESMKYEGSLQSPQNLHNLESDKYDSQTGYHHLQAQHVIRGNSMGFVNRSVPKHVEEDLSARVGMNAKRTAEKIVHEKMHSIHTRIDRLNDKIGDLSEDSVKIHREYGLLARQLAAQDRLTKRLKQEYEHQKNLVTKLGEAMANDVGWKESITMDIKMIKDQMRQDSATCVTTGDMKDALETITTKTMLAMERSAMSAKLAFESDVALLKQEMSYLKHENEKLKKDLIVTRDASKALTTKLEKGHITTVIANAVENQLQKIEQKVTQAIRSSIEHDLALAQEKMNGSVVDKVKDALGREIVQGGGDFHRVISGMIVKTISDDGDILDALSDIHRGDEQKSDDSENGQALRVQSRLDFIEKRLEVLVSKKDRTVQNNINPFSLMTEDLKNLISPIEISLKEQMASLETTLKEYCDKNIESFASTVANALEQIQTINMTCMESSNLTQALGSSMKDLESKMKEELGLLKHDTEAEFLDIINKYDSRVEKTETYLKRNMEHIQNDQSCMKRQLNELESKDITNLFVDINALKNSVETLKNSKNYSVEDLASCLGKVTSLENKLRQEMGNLRSEFIDLQGNVYDQNAASSERIELMIQQVQKDIERLGIRQLDDSRENPPPDFITIKPMQDIENKEALEKIRASVQTLDKDVQALIFLPSKVESLEKKLSSQGHQFLELSGVLNALQTGFYEHMTLKRNDQPCQKGSLGNTVIQDILVVEETSTNENIDECNIHPIVPDVCLEKEEVKSKAIKYSQGDIDFKGDHDDDDDETQTNENDMERISHERSVNSAVSLDEKNSESFSEINSRDHPNLVTDDAEKDSYPNDLLVAQEEFQMGDSVEGVVSDTDEIESVASPLAEKSHKDHTSDSGLNDSDMTYESDFEEIETGF
jgi:hypothetical protein